MTFDQLTQDWIDDFRTENSRNAAIKTVNQFFRYLDGKLVGDYIQALTEDEKTKYRMINNFLNSLDIAPASVRQSFSFFKSYLRVVHGVKIDLEDRRQFIRFDPIPKVNRAALTREIIKDLCANAHPLHKTFYLIQSSSGMRASESLNLIPEYFDFEANPVTITIPARLTKTRQERLAFISKEAKKMLMANYDAYFGKKKTLNRYEQYFYQLRKRCGYLERYTDSINYKVNIHAMRAFFRTQSVKQNINSDIAEELIGHSGYLKTYKRIDADDLIKAYLKLEPALKIF
jgi:integrase